MIGSGNWGSVAARIAAQNARQLPDFDAEVRMWVYEEEVLPSAAEVEAAFHNVGEGAALDARGLASACSRLCVQVPQASLDEAAGRHAGATMKQEDFVSWWQSSAYAKTPRKLSNVINTTNENVKYLPGIHLGDNLRAVPDLAEAADGATMLVFVTPHQFIKGICAQLKPTMRPEARAISLIKGMEVTEDGFQLISELIETELGIDCCVLMGANIASEIALERFSEATVGHASGAEASGRLWKHLFHTSYFHVTAVPDPKGCELCGTLKNIVAIGAGLVDGLGLGNNTKAAIMRVGLVEMHKLARTFYSSVQTETFFESAGVADLITTCFGGRNRKCAEAYASGYRSGQPETWEALEARLLGGQKLQGVLTSHEVQAVLRKRGLESEFPLFSTINRICAGAVPPEAIVRYAERP